MPHDDGRGAPSPDYAEWAFALAGDDVDAGLRRNAPGRFDQTQLRHDLGEIRRAAMLLADPDTERETRAAHRRRVAWTALGLLLLAMSGLSVVSIGAILYLLG